MTDLSKWQGCAPPRPDRLEGRTVVLEAFSADTHAHDIWQALGGAMSANERICFFPDAPYRDADHFGQTYQAKQGEWHTMVMRDAHWNIVRGMASYMRMRPDQGSVEIGAVAHGDAMARSPLATEAHYLLAKHVFDDLGYRRYEWKLNDDNAPSHKAAVRLGFTFEGTFRQDMVVHGENRDTAWYSMLDNEWPSRKAALEAWLDPGNFAEDGQQIQKLEVLRVS
ncbi:MAG: GNAT family N-acetyltransferase [Rhizobiales bacterium]|nr:GNAT family N-acetyltransferase [Hyphomicrobiales bacterium]MBO6697771.1 GNAT family N-acetyltransferase [Hyphomicrobiales bacterium]MBO6735974.1 GNAT family N-acetyltransferase [Hyphomicrobiales bacterium]MBO6912444.1 GNAT family N-acetyltransferase [Hyphomicrobiales bacterium]MBO6955074.1 GNAT family N-acetyltransferase [Hyphomicrobiales bacterium]